MKKEALVFELELAEREVTIGGVSYVLRELTGRGRDAYLNGLAARLKTTGKQGDATVKDFNGLQASLITRCLFVNNEEKTPVDVAVVQAWPARVVASLFEAARELSGLGDEEDGGQEGND